ncbi:MAG: CDP-alcohol phosphatidyltransferase family protein [Candidatus Binatia bacterium]
MKGILLVPDQSAFLIIAGLPALTRVLCAGQKSGIVDWLVLAAEHTAECEQLIADERRLCDVRCTVTAQTLSHEIFTEWLGNEEAMVVPCTAIFDHRLIRQVAESCNPSPRTFIARDGQKVDCVVGDAAALWLLLRSEEPCFLASHFPVIVLNKGLWIPLTLGLQEVERRLFASLGRETDGFLARALDRKISRLLTRQLVSSNVTPNQITLVSFTLGLLSAWLLMQPYYWPRVNGSLLLLMSTTIDGCDGELARLKFLESEFGAKLDLLADNIVHLLLFPGIAVSLYRETQDPLYVTLAMVTIIGVLCSMVVAYLAIFRLPSDLVGGRGVRTPLVEFYERITGRDFAYILLLLVLFDRLAWFLWATAIGTYAFAGGLLWVFLWQRQAAKSRVELFSGETK